MDKSIEIFSLGSPEQTLTGQSYNAEEHENCGEDAAFRRTNYSFIVVMASTLNKNISPSPLSCLFIGILRDFTEAHVKLRLCSRE